ncbi:MAG: TIGR01841 family phasin [Ramlibacter sp.]
MRPKRAHSGFFTQDLRRSRHAGQTFPPALRPQHAVPTTRIIVAVTHPEIERFQRYPMYPFPQSVNPAVRSHLDAQVAFLNDLTKSMTRSVQDIFQLNMQLGQTLMEETALISQRLLTTERPNDALAAATARAQPATDKLRAYQQHLSGIAASAQVELARVTERHVQETARTARALSDEVTRVASEETDRNMRQQEETLKNFRDPFKQEDTRAGKSAMQAPGNLQSSGDGKAERPPFPGNVQGAAPTQQASNRTAGKSG